MATYKQAGVNISMGDICSQIAYKYAMTTFGSRTGLKGTAVREQGGFTGSIDMGDYLLVQNADGVGTKAMIAEMMGRYDTLGRDLVAMVADDAVCVGAEAIAITNVIDTNKVDKKVIEPLMRGLASVCRQQKILIPGGEIAELSEMVNGLSWNATAIGIVEKKKLINGKSIRPGDVIVGLHSKNFRSNGFTLVRYILKKEYGKNWHMKSFNGKRWGDITLEPSIVFSDAVLSLIGRFGKKSIVNVKGVAHITGGGIHGNLPRMFGKRKLKYVLDNLPKPPAAMPELIRMGRVPLNDAFDTWNMGVGMVLAVAKKDAEKAMALLKKKGITSSVIGKVTA
ncbi:MAG: phosphoribosylformylglycinamidine cyclo-ligase [Patescibacteria group bacterium]